MAGVTVKLCTTLLAALQLPSPAWLAVIEQRPLSTSVTVVPETVQTLGVVEAKLTVRPELAVAESGGGDEDSEMLDRAPKLIVWLPEPTTML